MYTESPDDSHKYYILRNTGSNQPLLNHHSLLLLFSVRNKHRGNNFTITMVTALILHYLSTDLVADASLFSLHWPILLAAAKMFFQNYLSDAVSSQSYRRVWSSLACCAMFCIIYYYLPVCLYCLPFRSHLLFFSFSNLFWKHSHVVFCDQVLCLLELGTMPEMFLKRHLTLQYRW